MPRRPIEFDPQAPLQPVAAPVQTNYAPFVPKQVAMPLEELKSLSDTLTGYSLQQAKKANKQAYAQGQQDALAPDKTVVDDIGAAHKELDSAEAEQEANQKALAAKVKEGAIPANANPWHEVGFEEVQARKVMAQYQDDLLKNMGRATATVDENGQPVAAVPASQIIEETWAKYRDNPFVKGHFGGKVAVEEKLRADARFAGTASEALGKAKSEAIQTQTATELGQRFLTAGLAGKALDPETISGIDNYVRQAQLKGLPDSRDAIKRGIAFAASSLAGKDDGEGHSREVTALRLLRDLKVGSTTAGDDAEIGDWLNKKITAAEESYDNVVAHKLAGREDQLKLDIGAAQRDVLKAYREAKANGDDPVAIKALVGKLNDEIVAGRKYGDNMDLVVESNKKFAEGLFTQDSKEHRDALLSQLDATDDPASVRDTARIALRNGLLSAEDMAVIDEHTTQRQSLTPLIEGSRLHSSAMDRLSASTSDMGDLPPAVRANLSPQARKIADGFRADELATARSLQGKPQAEAEEGMRRFYESRLPAVTQQMEALTAEPLKKRADKLAAIQDAIDHSRSPDPSLLDPSVLSPEEIAQHAKTGELAGNRDRFFSQRPFLEAQDQLERFVTSSLDKVSSPDLVEETKQAATTQLKREFRSTLNGILDKTPPAQVPAEMDKALQELLPDLQTRIKQTNIKTILESIAPGAKAGAGEKAVSLADFGKTSLSTAQSAAGQNAKDAAATLTRDRDPNVSGDAFNLVRDYLSGEGQGLFGVLGKVRREWVENRVAYAGSQLLDKPGLTEQTRGEAYAKLVAPMGIPAEAALAGKVTLAPSVEWVTERQRRLATAEASAPFLNYVRTINGVPQNDTRAEAEKELADVTRTIDISTAKIPAYTTPFFRSREELNDWRRTRSEDLARLAHKYGVPDGAEAFQTWLAHQATAIDRRNNAGAKQ